MWCVNTVTFEFKWTKKNGAAILKPQLKNKVLSPSSDSSFQTKQIVQLIVPCVFWSHWGSSERVCGPLSHLAEVTVKEWRTVELTGLCSGGGVALTRRPITLKLQQCDRHTLRALFSFDRATVKTVIYFLRCSRMIFLEYDSFDVRDLVPWEVR